MKSAHSLADDPFTTFDWGWGGGRKGSRGVSIHDFCRRTYIIIVTRQSDCRIAVDCILWKLSQNDNLINYIYSLLLAHKSHRTLPSYGWVAATDFQRVYVVTTSIHQARTGTGRDKNPTARCFCVFCRRVYEGSLLSVTISVYSFVVRTPHARVATSYYIALMKVNSKGLSCFVEHIYIYRYCWREKK